MESNADFVAFLRANPLQKRDPFYRKGGGPHHQGVVKNPRGPRNGFRQMQIAMRYEEFFARVQGAIHFQTVDELEEWFCRVEQAPPTAYSEEHRQYLATIKFARFMSDLRSLHNEAAPGVSAQIPRALGGVLGSRSRSQHSQKPSTTIHRPLREDTQGSNPSTKRTTHRQTHPTNNDHRPVSGSQPRTTPALSSSDEERKLLDERAELKREARFRLAVTIAQDLRQEMRTELEEKFREELREEVRTQLRLELRQEVAEELRGELRPLVAASLYESDDLREEVAEKIERDAVEAAEQEAAAEAEEEDNDESTVEAVDSVARNGHRQDTQDVDDTIPVVGEDAGAEEPLEDVTPQGSEPSSPTAAAEVRGSQLPEQNVVEPFGGSPKDEAQWIHVEPVEAPASQDAPSGEEFWTETEAQSEKASEGPEIVAAADVEGGESSAMLVGENQQSSMWTLPEVPSTSLYEVSPPIAGRKRKRAVDDEGVADGPVAKKLRIADDFAVEAPPVIEVSPTAEVERDLVDVVEQQPSPQDSSPAMADEVQESVQLPPVPESQPEPILPAEMDAQQVPTPETTVAQNPTFLDQQHLDIVPAPGVERPVQPMEWSSNDAPRLGFNAGVESRVVEGVSAVGISPAGARGDEPIVVSEEAMGDAEAEVEPVDQVMEVDPVVVNAVVPGTAGQTDTRMMDDDSEGIASHPDSRPEYTTTTMVPMPSNDDESLPDYESSDDGWAPVAYDSVEMEDSRPSANVEFSTWDHPDYDWEDSVTRSTRPYQQAYQLDEEERRAQMDHEAGEDGDVSSNGDASGEMEEDQTSTEADWGGGDNSSDETNPPQERAARAGGAPSPELAIPQEPSRGPVEPADVDDILERMGQHIETEREFRRVLSGLETATLEGNDEGGNDPSQTTGDARDLGSLPLTGQLGGLRLGVSAPRPVVDSSPESSEKDESSSSEESDD
ncbi:MAG: hypothetical protein M4579_006436 [Chaenotheca gracillima]|nr:MAG: hypothetical protein M4579_006436 [Chaenotheca gracillima]